MKKKNKKKQCELVYISIHLLSTKYSSLWLKTVLTETVLIDKKTSIYIKKRYLKIP